MTEKFKEKLLGVFGYTSEDLNCANAETAISEMFDNDHDSNPTTLLMMFIENCTTEKFSKLKKQLNND